MAARSIRSAFRLFVSLCYKRKDGMTRHWFVNPRNGCSACGRDFSALRYFDAHRVGVHAYTYWEGLRRDPPVEDGRRCLDVEEMRSLGWALDRNGRWSDPARVAMTRELFGKAA